MGNNTGGNKMVKETGRSYGGRFSFAGRLSRCLENGFKKGIASAVWLLTIMAPVSLIVTIISYSGLLKHFGRLISPFFRIAGLPGEAALPFLTGAFINIYAGIAAMGTMALNPRQVTILALMMLFSHNLPVEVHVQRKAGMSALGVLSLRLSMSLLAALALNYLLPAHPGVPVAVTGGTAVQGAFTEIMETWAKSLFILMGRVSAILVLLMFLQSILAEFNLMRPLSVILRPLLRAMGLPGKTAFLWIVANTLGLAYGATVILEEIESGVLDPQEVEILNRSIALCHSLLEDTLLFVAVGAFAPWITLPRVAVAAAAAWIYRFSRFLRGLSGISRA